MVDLHGVRHPKTERDAWGGPQFLERDGDRYFPGGDSADGDFVQDELAAALQAAIGWTNAAGLREVVNEILIAEGIGSMDDLGGESLTELMQGILQ